MSNVGGGRHAALTFYCNGCARCSLAPITAQAKPLVGGSFGVVFLNRGGNQSNTVANITLDFATLPGVATGAAFSATDLWADDKRLGVFLSHLSAQVAPASAAFYKLTPTNL